MTMSRKRIGMVVHAYYLRDARVIRYAEALANSGHEVSVVCLQDPDEAVYERVNGVDIHRVRFERRRGGKAWYMLEYVLAFVLFFVRLTQLELKQHFDIIHVHNMPDFLIFAGFVPRLRGALLVLDLHDPMPELFMSKYDMARGMLIRLIELQERVSLWYADRLITVDSSFKEMFVRRGTRADKISIVRNMPDDRFLRAGAEREEGNGPRDDRFVLIYAGTIAERYQLDDVIRAVDIAREKVPNILLQLVGKLDKEGAYTQALLALVEQLNLHEHVVFHPPVLLDEIPALLQKAHVGLEPSRHDPYTDYVLPLKLLECVAAGVPCVVSRRPTIERYFGADDVFYFEPGDVEGLAALLVRLAGSRDELNRAAAHARRIFERYNWANERESYFRVLFHG